MVTGGDDRHAGQKRAERAAEPLLINCGRHGSHPFLSDIPSHTNSDHSVDLSSIVA
jgi:hypothetical protein